MGRLYIERYSELVDYSRGLQRQLELWEESVVTSCTWLMLLEHNPVVTLGRRTDPSHLMLSSEEYFRRGIDVVQIERGGSVTYHGPGQVVGYVITPVAKHGGTHRLVTKVMDMVERCISSFGIVCCKNEELPGVWTVGKPQKKLAAVGMQIRKGVSLHGFAINVDMDLEPFGLIMPCGLPDPVSTLSLELSRSIAPEEVMDRLEKIAGNYLQ